jgi:hypothetical protein
VIFKIDLHKMGQMSFFDSSQYLGNTTVPVCQTHKFPRGCGKISHRGKLPLLLVTTLEGSGENPQKIFALQSAEKKMVIKFDQHYDIKCEIG